VESSSSQVEQVLRRDRQVVVAALLLVVALAWVYTLAGVGMEMNALEMTYPASAPMMTGDLTTSTSMSMPQWSAGYAGVMLTMWWVMMVGMMLPSAAPTILLAAAINRRSNTDRPPYGPAGFFAAGYLLAWLCFSAVAVAAQWALESGGQLSVTMQSTSAYLTGGLLLAAGLWQLTPIKQACLRHCRSPMDYLVRHRRPGIRGALFMGIGHGTYCLGCCWFLMALLFAGGVMNLYWIVGLALFVLAEKVLARGEWFGRLSGVGLIVAGTATLLL
jgi:predicted metal-binding membrane protein